MKLSGNIAKKTRLGLLNVATKLENDKHSQNFSAFVLQQQLSASFSATGFLINKQENDGFSFLDEYNRVGGVNLNYQSNNNKWTASLNLAQSFNNNNFRDANFYNLGVWYSNTEVAWNASVKKVQKNYITEVGFVPRLYNFDAETQSVIREGYTEASGRLSLTKFFKGSKIIDNYRYLDISKQIFWDDQGNLNQASVIMSNDLVFKNQSFFYGSLRYEYVNLKYAFDPLRNTNAIVAGKYKYVDAEIGYSSAQNKNFEYGGTVSYGTYYSGHKNQVALKAQYRLMPLASLQIRYERNRIDLKDLGSKTFHLARFTGEVFFSNRLNWTTYLQYNSQIDNFNINSRLQWEYHPLSYIYLVVSDNYNKYIARNNWGIAFKMNYRFDF